MNHQPVSLPRHLDRTLTAEEINRAMARFPLILQILGELNDASIPFPGDADLRHGCERALTSMLSELARIEPAAPGRSSASEESAHGWLQHPRARQLVDADRLERLQQLIDSILPAA